MWAVLHWCALMYTSVHQINLMYWSFSGVDVYFDVRRGLPTGQVQFDVRWCTLVRVPDWPRILFPGPFYFDVVFDVLWCTLLRVADCRRVAIHWPVIPWCDLWCALMCFGRAGPPAAAPAARLGSAPPGAAPAAPPVKVINPAARAAPPGRPRWCTFDAPHIKSYIKSFDAHLMYHASNHDPPKPLLFDVLFDVQMECIWCAAFRVHQIVTHQIIHQKGHQIYIKFRDALNRSISSNFFFFHIWCTTTNHINLHINLHQITNLM